MSNTGKSKALQFLESKGTPTDPEEFSKPKSIEESVSEKDIEELSVGMFLDSALGQIVEIVLELEKRVERLEQDKAGTVPVETKSILDAILKAVQDSNG